MGATHTDTSLRDLVRDIHAWQPCILDMRRSPCTSEYVTTPWSIVRRHYLAKTERALADVAILDERWAEYRRIAPKNPALYVHPSASEEGAHRIWSDAITSATHKCEPRLTNLDGCSVVVLPAPATVGGPSTRIDPAKLAWLMRVTTGAIHILRPTDPSKPVVLYGRQPSPIAILMPIPLNNICLTGNFKLDKCLIGKLDNS